MVKKSRNPRNQISRHPERVAIEMARMGGVTLDKIAARYGVTRDAIWRHMDKLPDSYKANLIADVPREELAARAAEETGTLLDHFKLIRNIAETQLIVAKGCSDHFAVANLTRAAIKANQEVGKLTGEIERLHAGGITINNNTMVALASSPEFRAFETGLIDIARKHPGAKDDILALIRMSKAIQAAPLTIEHAHAAA